jgi:putative copper export protein/mono/diheme cytochrome c family protein
MLLVLARALNLYGSGVALGISAALALVILPPLRGREAAVGIGMAAVLRRSIRVALFAVAVAILSGVAWLLSEVAAMSGGGLAAAASPGLIGAVLWRTEFGTVLLTRLTLTLALAAVLVASERRPTTRGRIAAFAVAGLFGGGGFLAVAWSGHAAASADRFQLAADLVHLLAAGLWLGGLVALAVLLAAEAPDAESAWVQLVAAAARRFFWLGIACVSALIASGAVNSWYMVGSVPALIGTEYGHLLLVKLALFGTMLGFAAANQFRLTPALEGAARQGLPQDAAPARRALRRNAAIEAVLGLLIIGLVSGLGAVPPGMHSPPSWPFSWRLSLEATELPAVLHEVLLAAVLVAVGLALCVTGLFRRRHRWLWVIIGLALIAGFGPSFRLLTVTAYPTTFERSTTPYTTGSIAHGAQLYAANCTACHGSRGKGDGPAAAALAVAPADLTAAHVLDHSEGDIFWWLGAGIPESGMPGFAATMSKAQRWDLVNFVRTLPVGALDDGLTPELAETTAARAPDFVFRTKNGGDETLIGRAAAAPLLLVFFTPADALAEDSRLHRLAASREALAEAGLDLIALPLPGPSPVESLDPALGDIVAEAGPDVAAVYRLIATARQSAASAPRHLEFLVDRAGYLRALWQPGAEGVARLAAGWDDLRFLIGLVSELDEHPIALMQAPAMHMHMHME